MRSLIELKFYILLRLAGLLANTVQFGIDQLTDVSSSFINHISAGTHGFVILLYSLL